MDRNRKFVAFSNVYWPTFVLILTPLLLLPIIFVMENSLSNRCLYVLLLMAIYWATEALPLAITSMLPIVLFPVTGIMDTPTTCKYYMSEATMMFIGGLTIALALEQSELHTRVALIIISKIGCSPRKLTIGLFFCTAFISMWISNTAAVSIMIPIIMGVLQELEEQGLCNMYEEIAPPFQGQRKVIVLDRQVPSKTTLCYFLGSAFASSIGGSGTIIGSGASMVLKGIFEKRFPSAPELNFNHWLCFNIVMVIFGILLTWVYLQWLYMGMFRPDSPEALQNQRAYEIEHIAKDVIQQKLRNLGPMNTHQISVAILFCLAIVAYLSRDPGFVAGWGSLFIEGSVRDTTAALVIVVLFFILPRNYEFLKFFTATSADKLPKGPSQSLLTWKFVHEKMEWGILLLLGGGFALSGGGSVSGLNSRIGHYFTSFVNLPRFAMISVVTVIIQMVTEVSSNMTVATIVLPVFAEMVSGGD